MINFADIKRLPDDQPKSLIHDFYSIALKRNFNGKLKYGQHYYDFDKGVLSFTAPKQVQVLDLEDDDSPNNGPGTGYVLLFHPDFLGNHPLATTIKNYGFFSYAVNEALHLSEREERNIIDTFIKIEREYEHIDRHTQEIIVSQLDLLLNYCNRFYERQFITRKLSSNDLLIKMENLLHDYFDNRESLNKGLSTMEHFAGKLNLSAHYLSDMLRLLTGQSAQQHIHEKLIEKAKEYLTVTSLSVAETACQLGFEYPQSFNKLFKKKTIFSPLEFRQSFN